MYRDALREALCEEMRRDDLVFVMGEGIGLRGGSYKVTLGMLDEFGPKRIIDTPLAEASFIGAGVGAAMTGMRPVVEILFVDFTMLGMDQIVNQAAKFRFMTGKQGNVPLVLRTQGGTGNGVAAQHSQSLEALFYHIPGLKLVVPSTPFDAKGLLKSAIREDNPVIFIEHKFLYNDKGPVPEEEYTIPLGAGEVKRPGEDVTIVAIARMVHMALQAAEQLSEQGIEAEVIDPRTLVPLDKEIILRSVERTGRLLVVHEECTRCGFGAEIISIVASEGFDYLDAPLERLGAPNTPVPFAPVLENYFIPSAEDIVKKVQGML